MLSGTVWRGTGDHYSGGLGFYLICFLGYPPANSIVAGLTGEIVKFPSSSIRE